MPLRPVGFFAGGIDPGGREARRLCLFHLLSNEQVHSEGPQVREQGTPSGKQGSTQGQAIVPCGIEQADPGLGVVGGDQGYLDQLRGWARGIEGQQATRHLEAPPWGQRFVFMLGLDLAVDLGAITAQNLVRPSEVEQGWGRNGQNERRAVGGSHGAPPK